MFVGIGIEQHKFFYFSGFVHVFFVMFLVVEFTRFFLAVDAQLGTENDVCI
jgi:hypothetical protein